MTGRHRLPKRRWESLRTLLPRGRRLLPYAALVVCVVTLVVVTLSVGGQPSQDRGRHWFGTLQTEPAAAQREKEHGVTVAHLQVDWSRLEPSPGHFDRRYLAELRTRLAAFRTAGMKVEAGLGLNQPPRWLFERHPEAAFTDQHGKRSRESANLVFSQDVRDAARNYLQRLDRALGLNSFWAIRVGVNGSGEFTYPDAAPAPEERSGGHHGSFWAFDRYARAAHAEPGRAEGVPMNPYPGWRPGQRTHHGAEFTPRQALRWYEWYLSSLAGAVNWQVDRYDDLGYRGLLKVLVPGTGLRPAELSAAVRDRLGDGRESALLGEGAGFSRTIGRIQHQDNVQIVSTALVDGSGIPRDNVCRPEDKSVGLDGRTHNGRPAAVENWSSVRWIARIATLEDFPLSGESAGAHVAPYHPGVMDRAAWQMRACGLKGLMWAFDANLHDGTEGTSLKEYAAVIEEQDR
ncbi:beta-galactosidase [Streptomyces sp. NA04227]|uniref:beta-galactosidase n=1 Tax=Streptomyces sp. NA04227 TaxID=2742136 RepID=UPI001590C6D0|nr:beta-galactosidase [Streptomyces sp. NA04227]QKW09739.1 beta-galactosidase [Streptomyces sp. NA04227]